VRLSLFIKEFHDVCRQSRLMISLVGGPLPVLLLSVFFTSFFLPITGFAWPAWIIALLIPMTYAVDGLQSLMLMGASPSFIVWFGLIMLTLLSYGLVLLIMRRQYRKVLD
jgi:ABC-type polysaccharide/polyol phosphate export permease